jgi:hypothetical protein
MRERVSYLGLCLGAAVLASGGTLTPVDDNQNGDVEIFPLTKPEDIFEPVTKRDNWLYCRVCMRRFRTENAHKNHVSTKHGSL